MRPYDDPRFLSSEERFEALACLLAVGLLRLRERGALATAPGEHPAPKNPEKTGNSCLELSGETVLSVHTG
jgi:hypothetical protein